MTEQEMREQLGRITADALRDYRREAGTSFRGALASWEEMGEEDREAGRRMGLAVYQWARREALEQVQEFVVLHTFDTTVGRRIDDYITELLKAEEPER
jgi:hypothetical protein